MGWLEKYGLSTHLFNTHADHCKRNDDRSRGNRDQQFGFTDECLFSDYCFFGKRCDWSAEIQLPCIDRTYTLFQRNSFYLLGWTQRFGESGLSYGGYLSAYCNFWLGIGNNIYEKV